MKRKIVIGNWKMNPVTLEEARRIFRYTKNLAGKFRRTSVVVCPPFVYLSTFLARKSESPVIIGAQDVYFEEFGPHTGEISAPMLRDLGVTHVIVGHSERRAKGDTDEVISKKVLSLLEVGIHPILCVGEKERDQHGTYLDVLKNQIRDSLNKIPKKHADKLIMAYEPLWAIGAKDAVDPATICEMSIFVKKVLSDIFGHDEAISATILYGGAVNFRNAGDIIAKGQVDGLLVGRESVNTAGFGELLRAVDSL